MITQQTYLNLAAGFLAIAGVAKLHTATGEARILAQPDPVLTMSHRTALVAVGVLELAVAAYLFFGRNLRNKHLVVVWLGMNFLAHRLALAWIAPGKPCACLGALPKHLPFRPQTSELFLRLMIACMILASSAFLLAPWRRTNRHHTGTGASEGSAEVV